MSECSFGFSFDMELEKPLDFFYVNYKNGDKVMYDKRPHGEWNVIRSKSETAAVIGVCSNCGFSHFFVDGYTEQYNYCPNCGSDNRPKEGEAREE